MNKQSPRRRKEKRSNATSAKVTLDGIKNKLCCLGFSVCSEHQQEAREAS